MGSVRARRFHQRDGVTERLAQGYSVRMGNHAALQTDVQGLLILILTDACAHFAIGRFVIGVDAGGVTAAGAAQPFWMFQFRLSSFSAVPFRPMFCVVPSLVLFRL